MKNILFFFFLTFNLFAQSSPTYLMIPKVKVGAAYSGLSTHYFVYADGESHTMYPGYSVGIGLETAGLLSYYNTDLSLALETSYGQSTTGEVVTNLGKSIFTHSSLPILLWAKIKSNGKINPFVRIGIGTERTRLVEKYYSASQLDFDLKEWFFSWGVGAGIDLDFDNYNISVFTDFVIKEGGIAETLKNGEKINFTGRNTFNFFGLQFGYKI